MNRILGRGVWLSTAILLLACSTTSDNSADVGPEENGHSCAQDQSCVSGYCDPYSQTCAELPGYLEACLWQCPEGMVCSATITEGNNARCLFGCDQGCPDGTLCQAGVCQPKCDANSHLAAEYACVAGTPTPCRDAPETACSYCGCPATYQCVDTECRFLGKPWDPNDKRLFPLEDLRQWQFREIANGNSYAMTISTGAEGPRASAWLGIYEPVRINVGTNPNDVTVTTNAYETIRVLSQILKEGESWVGINGALWQYYYEGTVTVKAGTFQSCWRTALSSGKDDTYSIWCPGIGPVRVKDKSYHDIELVSMNFKQ